MTTRARRVDLRRINASERAISKLVLTKIRPFSCTYFSRKSRTKRIDSIPFNITQPKKNYRDIYFAFASNPANIPSNVANPSYTPSFSTIPWLCFTPSFASFSFGP